MKEHPLRVLIAGGGVAALEAALTLLEVAERRVTVELLAPEPHFWYRPLAVAEPFGVARVHPIELAEIAAASGAVFTPGALACVDPGGRVARTATGMELDYDALLVATGARPVAAVPGADLFRGLADTHVIAELMAKLNGGTSRHVAFALPSASTWPLPLYELALFTSSNVRVTDVVVEVVTPEAEPLELFGHEASAVVSRLLEKSGVVLHAGRHPVSFIDGTLTLVPHAAIEADCVVALPRLQADPILGLPCDANGFIPTDSHGRVVGVADVFAAGDVTAFPVKQGGLAAQQADAAATTIAAAAGADVKPEPFRPVLRGLLLTGGAPTYLRTELPNGISYIGSEPLWWPPGKIVGNRLGPFLAERAGSIVSQPASADVLGSTSS